MKTFSNVPANLQLHELFRGCLLGGAVGDALGAPVEFLHRSEILKQHGNRGIRDFVPAYGRLGAITDDSQMALFTAEGMLRAWVMAGKHDVKSAFVRATAASYLRWLHTQGYSNTSASRPTDESGWLITNHELFSRRAPGATCISALRRMTNVVASNESKGCGGVMRVAPVGMFFSHWIGDGQVQRTFQVAAGIAGITHGHPTGQLTAGVFAVIIALLLRGTALNEAVAIAKAELRKHDWHQETLASIELAEHLSISEPNSPDAVRKLGEGWIAEEALAISLYCALCAKDLESGVVLAVNHDGDSDSTGSITGNLLGCIHGVGHIPQRWLEPLELRTVIEEMADDLATAPDWKIGEPEAYYTNRYPRR